MFRLSAKCVIVLLCYEMYVTMNHEKAQDALKKNKKGRDTMEQRTLIRKQEVMQMLNIGRSKFYQLTQQPDFPSLKIGRYVYVDRNRLNDWIARQIDRKTEAAD